MKALILNGSPHPQGVVVQALRTAADTLRQAGADIEWIDVYRTEFRPCTGCMQCRATNVCPLPRDAAPCRRRTDPAGRPARGGDSDLLGRYVSAAEDALRAARSGFHGRIGSRPSAAPAKGKRALVIAACTTPWPFNILARQSRGAVRSVRESIGYGRDESPDLRNPRHPENERQTFRKGGPANHRTHPQNRSKNRIKLLATSDSTVRIKNTEKHDSGPDPKSRTTKRQKKVN